ncbi:MAG: acetyl-CoA carboxylase biotin carboxylase subunit [Deltaproteobacteria bacterium]|nr:acetyl-CoA carboxylase biotin carboxylase subunit [Deltaproteobacteria bacterium]
MKPNRPTVLIANRGEIAIRIARTCKLLGFPTVAVYSEADQSSEHVFMCDQAYCLGGILPKDSYLNISSILDIAKKSKAKLIHPGYGFLSERADFIEACQKANLIFIGPSAKCVALMGNKVAARMAMDQLKIARVPGSHGTLSGVKEAKLLAKEIGYPVLLKAKAGGGGKGMRQVESEKFLESSFEAASREAEKSFGDSDLYLEKLILSPHHVEVQVFGDGKGGGIHLGERECSIQRRHQKILEETPSPVLELFPKTREKLFEAALKIIKNIKYQSAGTLEFIVDEKGNFYFLEMNTRLQVEHPVTEWVTGVDLVEWQLLQAIGELQLPEIPPRTGHSIEVRLYAEDPESFLPAPGSIGFIEFASGPFVRVDSAFKSPTEVSMYYDPMIAKISVWGATREKALARLRVSLDEIRVEPLKNSQGHKIGSLKTNLFLLQKLVRNKKVLKGDTPTDLIAKEPELKQIFTKDVTLEAALAVSLYQLIEENVSLHEGTVNLATEIYWTKQSKTEGLRS